MARTISTKAMEHSTLNPTLRALLMRRNSLAWDNKEIPTNRHPGRPVDRTIILRALSRILCRIRRPDRRLPRHTSHQNLDRASPIRPLLNNNVSNRLGQAATSILIRTRQRTRQLRTRISGRPISRRMRTPTVSSSHNLPVSRPITRQPRTVILLDIVG